MVKPPAPKTIADEIIPQLNEMLRSGNVDRFTINRFKRRAQKLIEAHEFALAFTILGMIDCLEKNYESMHSHHKNALRYAPDNPDVLCNYGISLKNAGLLEVAYENFLRAHEIQPTRKYFLNLIIKVLFDLTAGNKKYEPDFKFYSERWQQLTGEHHPIHNKQELKRGKVRVCETIMYRRADLLKGIDHQAWKLAKEIIKSAENNDDYNHQKRSNNMIITHHREKLINAILYFARNTKYCGKIKLLKLLYFLDFMHFKQTGKPVTGMEYNAWPMGPVPETLFHELTERMKPDLERAIQVARGEGLQKISSKQDFNPRFFTNREMKLLSDISEVFRDAMAEDMIESTHLKNSPWDRTIREKGKQKRIDYMLAFDEDETSLNLIDAKDIIAERIEMYDNFGVE